MSNEGEKWDTAEVSNIIADIDQACKQIREQGMSTINREDLLFLQPLNIDGIVKELKEQYEIDISNNPDWLEWYESRPDHIKEFIDKYPPNKIYRIQAGIYPGIIYSYDEPVNGDNITMTVRIHDPLFPRKVFGLKPTDIEVWK